ncbi:ATP-binding cassette domain-containing protein [Acrocarpospora pleiomorpha]
MIPRRMPTIGYGPFARMSDWYQGWRDGRAGIPARPPQGAPLRPVSTGHMDMLVHRAQDAFHHEHLHLLAAWDEDPGQGNGRGLGAAQMRALRIYEHTSMRIAAYRRSLVRWHRHGVWVNDAMTKDRLDRPSWAFPLPPALYDDPSHTAAGPAGPGSGKVTLRGRVISLRPVTVFGSAAPPADEVLPTPGLALRHFRLERAADGVRVRGLGYGHGPYIDGRIARNALLRPGGHFDVGAFRYWLLDGGDALREIPLGAVPARDADDVTLTARRCDLVVSEVDAKFKDKPRLTRMSFVQHAGDLLAIVGPSGAGKTSLFWALLGELPISSGEVYFRGLDLRKHSDQIREQLGFVPQHDDVHMTLSTRSLLRYAYRLRAAGRAGRDARIAEVCRQLRIEKELDKPPSQLSGGQRKRVSIALELLAEPSLLMLDEPTSGLDVGLDREVMAALRDYAAADHAVIIITHWPNHLSMAQQVLAVAEEGRPVYSGPPDGLCPALGGADHADVMDGIRADPRPKADAYAASSAATARAAARQARAGSAAAALVRRKRGAPAVLAHQLPVLIARQAALVAARGTTRSRETPTISDWVRSVWSRVWLWAVPFGGAVLTALAGDAAGLGAGATASAGSLNLLVTFSMLTGQALTYSDLVTEFPILRREHRTGVRTASVTLSKWLVYAVIAMAQALVIVWGFTRIRPGPVHSVMFSPAVELWCDLGAMTITAMSLGLLISAAVKTLKQAVNVVTFITIAQIVFNGVTKNLSDEPVASVFAALLPARWGLAAAAASIDLRGMGPSAPDALWRHTTGQWLFDLAMLGVMSAVFLAIATVLLRHRLTTPDR